VTIRKQSLEAAVLREVEVEDSGSWRPGAGPDDTWKRPDCVQGTGKALPLYGPSRGPRYEDVRQINLGDCWLMAALASVANTQPDTIREMITPVQKEDSSGNTLGSTKWSSTTRVNL